MRPHFHWGNAEFHNQMSLQEGTAARPTPLLNGGREAPLCPRFGSDAREQHTPRIKPQNPPREQALPHSSVSIFNWKQKPPMLIKRKRSQARITCGGSSADTITLRRVRPRLHKDQGEALHCWLTAWHHQRVTETSLPAPFRHSSRLWPRVQDTHQQKAFSEQRLQ